MKVLRVLLCFLLAAPGAAVLAQEARADRFIVGGSALVTEPVTGDLIAAAGELRVSGPVSGDVVAAGGTLRLDGTVAQNVYAAGGQVALDGAFARNARVAGGSVTIGPKAQIHGNASLAGGRVEMRGAVDGYLLATAGRVLIDGRVAGDVNAAAGELELGPQARIAGKLRYTGRAVRMDAAAQVLGGVERFEETEPAARPRVHRLVGFWTLGLMVFAALLVWVFPARTARVADAAQQRFGWSLLVGFIALAALPVAIVLLLITVIGLPLAVLGALGYLALLLTGYVASGIALGEIALRRLLARHAAQSGWRAAAAALGVLVIGLLALVPWLGKLVTFLALVAGMGAVLLQLRAASRDGVDRAPGNVQPR